MADLGALIARLFLAALFVQSGFGMLTAVGGIAKLLASKGFPQPTAFGYAVGLVEFVGGLLILIGYKTRWVALILLVFTAGTVVVSHNFWALEGAAAMAQRTQALKNLGIMGGFLLLASFGPGRLSVDRR